MHFYFSFTIFNIILQKRNTLPNPICKWGTKGIVMLNTRLRSICWIVLSKPGICNGFEQKFLSKLDRNEAFLDTPSENFSKPSQSNDTIILEQNKKTKEDRPEPQFLLFHRSRDNQARVFKTFRGWRGRGRKSNTHILLWKGFQQMIFPLGCFTWTSKYRKEWLTDNLQKVFTAPRTPWKGRFLNYLKITVLIN